MIDNYYGLNPFYNQFFTNYQAFYFQAMPCAT